MYNCKKKSVNKTTLFYIFIGEGVIEKHKKRQYAMPILYFLGSFT